jgi:hypothetical protein
MPPHCIEHTPSSLAKVLGNLAARAPGTNDKYVAWRKIRRSCVAVCRYLMHGDWKRRTASWDGWELVRPSRNNHVRRLHRRLTSLHRQPSTIVLA